jgi:small nuclear ribonucleoprotein
MSQSQKNTQLTFNTRLHKVNNMAMPLRILERNLDKYVGIRLKDGRFLEGKITGYDDYMNLVLEDTKETFEDNERKLGTVILRGNNLISIAPQ